MRLANCVAILGEAVTLKDKLCVPREKSSYRDKAQTTDNRQLATADAQRPRTTRS
jgi:hypothetical protein